VDSNVVLGGRGGGPRGGYGGGNWGGNWGGPVVVGGPILGGGLVGDFLEGVGVGLGDAISDTFWWRTPEDGEEPAPAPEA